MRKAGVLKRFNEGMQDAFGEGREDNRRAHVYGREDEGKEAEASRIEQMFGQNRTFTMLREMFGVQPKNEKDRTIIDKIFKADPYAHEARVQMGMALSNDPVKRAGQIVGHLGADLTQDRSREVWWLLNAPQAVGNVANEFFISRANPDIFNKMETFKDKANGNQPVLLDGPRAIELGAVDPKSARLRKGFGSKTVDGEKIVTKRKFNPGNTVALGIPVGIAINSGIGLLNPTGGQEGYEAAIPDQEDKSKTSNMLAEVGSKYILGRSGNLLPWSEFKEVRPDVSKDEYMRYKAFKFDKEGDGNIFDDGQITLPSGVLKYNNDGIHGAEVQFLGRSLPLHTTILPAATAIAGTALGVRGRRPITQGFLGGMAGLTGGMVTGNSIEAERRRRNAAANELDNINEEGIQLKS